MKTLIACLMLMTSAAWAASNRLDTAKIEQLTGLKGVYKMIRPLSMEMSPCTSPK